jgi:hypothetical protein
MTDCTCNYDHEITEAEHEGKKVKLNDPFRLPSGSKKKFGVYVKNDKGNIVKVTFGDPNMEIKRDDPKRLKAYRSRMGCDTDPGPKWKANYWSCYQWRSGAKVDEDFRLPTFGEHLDEVVSQKTRMKMKQAFRKNKAKIMRARKKAAKKPQLQKGQIEKKAELQARKSIEKKILKGKSKTDLGIGAKAALEKQMARKQKAIKKIAMKIRKDVIAKEKAKIKKKLGGVTEETNYALPSYPAQTDVKMRHDDWWIVGDPEKAYEYDTSKTGDENMEIMNDLVRDQRRTMAKNPNEVKD